MLSGGAGTLLLMLGLLWGLSKVGGTTLTAPVIWAIIATIGLALVAVATSWGLTPSGIGHDVLQYAAAVATFCPLIGVLGAKRPQNHAWQWVVLTLWIVLVWPALGAWVTPMGSRLELFAAWKLFLLGLIGLGLLNYLPTRFWLAAINVACGQAVLLSNVLLSEEMLSAEWHLPIGVSCFLLSIVSVAVSGSLRKSTAQGLEAMNHHWRAFRDTFGAFWGLRILARVNQTAKLRNWPLRLAWTGFEPTNKESLAPTTEQLAEIEQTLATLLRRFL